MPFVTIARAVPEEPSLTRIERVSVWDGFASKACVKVSGWTLKTTKWSFSFGEKHESSLLQVGQAVQFEGCEARSRLPG